MISNEFSASLENILQRADFHHELFFYYKLLHLYDSGYIFYKTLLIFQYFRYLFLKNTYTILQHFLIALDENIIFKLPETTHSW